MTTERIDIRVREDGSRVVRRDLEALDPAARKAASGIDFLKRILAGLGGALAVREVLTLINTYQNLENRLRSTGLEGAALGAVYRELLAASNETRSSVEGSVELYARLATSSKELGVSQKQLISFTTSLNQAIILSGASATEAQAGLIQLSQGLASGVLRGDELRSVMEQLPAVADVIAKQMGVTRGELRKMGEEGKITAQTVLQAFQSARQELADRFAKTIPTLSQSFQILRNNVLTLIGEYDKATGASAALARAMTFLSNNLDTVVRAVAGVAAGFVLILGGAAAFNALRAAVVALNLAIAANPLGAFLIVVTSIVATLALFRNEINLGLGDITTLGDLLRAFGETAGRVFDAVLGYAEATFGPVIGYVREWFRETDISVIGILRVVASVADTFVGAWRGAVRATVAVFEGVPPALSDIFTQALNVVLGKISRFVNAAGELLSTVTEFAGLGRIASNIDFTLDNADAGAAARLGKDIAGAFAEGFNESNPAREFLDQMVSRAQEFSRARAEANRLAARFPAGASSVAGPAAKPPVDTKELEKAENALRSLLNTILPSSGAVLELAKAQRTLNEAQKAGLITAEQNQRYLALAQRYYQDVIDPLGKINRELDEQANLLRMTADEREIESQLVSISRDLQRQGIDLTQSETEELRAKLAAMRELNAVTQAQDAILARSLGARQEFARQVAALEGASRTPGFTSGDKAAATEDILRSAGIDPQGTQVALDAQVAAFEAMYAKLDVLRQRNLVSEETAAMLRQRIAIQQTEAQLANTQQFFGTLATLSKSGNKKIAAIGKAAAVAQATIDGILAVQKALASAPPPYNYALAAAVGVAAAANVSAIMKNGYMEGGYTGNVGRSTVAGVVHGQEYVVNADATARNRAVLEAMNRGQTVQPGGTGGSPVYMSVVVNNKADGAQATAQERQGPNGPEIEVLIENVAARSVRKGGTLAAALESQYGLNRGIGAPR